jgi:NAD(P)-dependent dehydrogenase (short-subunit alcohol dehydrogenase family)
MLETVESRPVPVETRFELTVTKLFDLSGNVAIVTGGSRGLGKEMADGLGEAGATVVITARRRCWLDPALEDLRSRGVEAMAIEGDTANEDDVQRIVAETVATYGQLDIVVNNAGITWGAPAEDYPLEKWRQVIDVNLTGVWLMAKYAARQMIAAGRGGRIINNASIMGLIGADPIQHDTVSYNASKAGVIGLTRDLAVKWARHNILVNAIAPGYFPTRMTDLLPDAAEEMIIRDAPLGRFGRYGELKGACVFLASAAASYITGQTIVVDGGLTAR